MTQPRRKTVRTRHADTAFESLIGYNLKRAYLVVQKDYRRAVGPDGLSPRVFASLSFVVADPNLTQSDLARRLGIERSELVAIVDELERRGYLDRVPVPGDRRVHALRPSQAGRAAYQRAIARAQSHEAALLDMLNEGEKRKLLHLLAKIREAGEGEHT